MVDTCGKKTRKFDMVTTHGKKSKKKGSKDGRIGKPLKGYQSGRTNPNPKPELKAFDVTVVPTFATAAAGDTPLVLNAMVAGTEVYNRVGRKIYMKSVHIRGQIFSAATTALDEQELRMMLVYDSNPNAAQTTLGQLLLDSNVGGGLDVNSNINLDNRERFKVIKEWFWHQGGAAGANTGQIIATGQTSLQDGSQCLTVNAYIKLHGLEAVYNGTNAGTFADIASGSLLLFTFCDTLATNCWKFFGKTRLRYQD